MEPQTTSPDMVGGKPTNPENVVIAAVSPVESAVSPSTEPTSCPTCGTSASTSPPAYVYALGAIEARFPSLGVEKEFAQLLSRVGTTGRTDRQVFHEALSKRENRYLARQLCWIFSVQGLETYIMYPRDPGDIDLLISAIEPQSSPVVSAVVGMRGPIAPPEVCNGLLLPTVTFEQIYSFTRDELIKAIPQPTEKKSKDFDVVARELFDRIMDIADNAGATDGQRALNYIVMRYPAVYEKLRDQFARDFSLTSIETRSSTLSGTRSIMEVIFLYTSRTTDFVEKFCVWVDVTEMNLFLVKKLSPYFDH